MGVLMPYSGKEMSRMTWDELQLEKTIQLWFAARMVRLHTIMGYGMYRRKTEMEELYNIEEAEELFAKGEIDEKELKRRKKNRKIREKNYKKSEAEMEFLLIQENHARSIVAMIEEDLLTRTKPHKAMRKVSTPYRKYPEELVRSRRRIRTRRYKERLMEINRMRNWQKKLEGIGLGSLWDKDKFMLICADRGYVSKESVYVLVAQILNVQIKQVPIMLDKGAFTWGQVLALGAELYMNPKEFCDTFLSGYFVEIADGVFEASEENVPEMMPPKADKSDK